MINTATDKAERYHFYCTPNMIRLIKNDMNRACKTHNRWYMHAKVLAGQDSVNSRIILKLIPIIGYVCED